ncbi:hypothetical protein PybrP1_008935, partial [[Pythium] brassicae (nom. inval.)]
VYLPYPVVVDSARVALHRSPNCLRLSAAIDKAWDAGSADQGSAPWLLAQALHSEEAGDSARTTTAEAASEPAPPRSLAEMFHLELFGPRERAAASSTHGSAVVNTPPAQWDPVADDEELPEDRFHRKDMMSMHILEQRKAEREQKAKDADAKRRTQRADVEEKQRVARQAGKTWREMYPNDPETTYIDMERLLARQSARPRESDASAALLAKAADELLATEDARKAAAAWSASHREGKLSLRSALAFELLE